MGIILAKFRKEKTTIEVLEELETKIKDIESFSISTQARQKRFVGNFLVFSVGLYVIASIVFYFAFFPSTWSKRIIYSTPLLIFPILIILLKRLVAWYFQRKINRNANQLKQLRADKKKIIEQVMDKETYKVACEILNRFGDTATRAQHQPVASPSPNQSLIGSNLSTPQKQQPNKVGITPQTQPRQPIMPTARTPINVRSMPQSALNALQTPSFGQYRINSPVPTPVVARQHYGTPFPIINQNQKGMFEKIVDYLINDGPSSRYGMICKECYGHNGMVSQEEYEYSAFKCAFCKALNPAKKIRPIAPRLNLPERSTGETSNKPLPSQSQQPSSSAPVTDKDSGSESDAVTSELRKRKETIEPIETIPEPTATPAPEPMNEPNEDKDSKPSENVKTHNDKKNE
ncbi:endoplasmic reticulum junction formation protein lunapark-B [Contarinia nasturtii]|uniref:endoplasmic reticulum junction formation protein lunapark-B n=1 Tax=Contarinia nasturtii TaxID=265458 RepID=UPI0012D47A00|nr:endoplasmic reticulum junction formation protein lunapark-B [Contarinia nasturtii]XP_031634153.1 endoplasmic reticulum junction formation protein lunapark-B [Contarinia nasturtii]XP_031634160.1 endoplasmic reticulum junction formation protein lunapark-B [Contarinia nasturtii]